MSQPGGDCTPGWGVVQRGGGGGAVLCRQGGNTINFANAWVAPRRDFAIPVCVNPGGDLAFKLAG